MGLNSNENLNSGNFSVSVLTRPSALLGLFDLHNYMNQLLILKLHNNKTVADNKITNNMMYSGHTRIELWVPLQVLFLGSPSALQILQGAIWLTFP